MVHMLVQGVQLPVGCNRRILQGSAQSQQSDHCCGWLHVPDVGLDATKHLIHPIVSRKCPTLSACFDRIAQRSPRAVALDCADAPDVKLAIEHCSAQQGDLRLAVGRRQAGTFPVGPYRAATQPRSALHICQQLSLRRNQHPTHTLGARIAIGARVKKLASPVPRRHARIGDERCSHWQEHEIDCEGESILALSVAHFGQC
mmetsp:Transcript_33971/g.93322  ORF Transcript_33971/g.93322 Transcript_33971/m.93322 type:complete len:201 (-) Transcript_33971:2903-3505(-)